MHKILPFLVFLFLSGCTAPKAFFVTEQQSGYPATFSVEDRSAHAQNVLLDCGNGVKVEGSNLSCQYLLSGRYKMQLTALKGQKTSVHTEEIIVPAPDQCLLFMETSKGSMVIRLFDETPLHRDNFIQLAEKGFYEGLLFHRVINGFMMQGGDPDTKNAAKDVRVGGGNPGYTIPAEIHQKSFHIKGALAAARTGDDINPKKESSGSQFYIVHGRKTTSEELHIFEGQKNIYYPDDVVNTYKTSGGAPQLDGEYTIFGEVIQGFDVIDRIATVPTDSYDRPKEDVKILKVTVLK
ncbi:MAG: peptidylprolyl isomerase [Saprospiraceae bacterium]|nr:peptidylprolyl isomerase [Saprospiraceae bacterium]